jgi:hypothetical protein
VVLFVSVIVSYSVLGLFSDAFIGRYKLIQIGLWIQWITVITSTVINVMLEYYHIAQWVQSLLFLILFILYYVGTIIVSSCGCTIWH